MKAKTLLFIFAILMVPSFLNAQNSGLILPMPGQIFEQPKQTNEESQKNKPYRYTNSKSDEKPKGMIIPNKSIDSKKVFIPLPASGQRSKPQPPKFQTQQKPMVLPVKSEPSALIQLPANTNLNNSEQENLQQVDITTNVPQDIPTAHQAKMVDDIPLDPSQIKVQNNNAPGIEPPMITTEAPQVVTTETDGTVTVFPKDTSSAIFMVMKSWQCEDYDATTLLDHAVGVYSQDSDDNFQITGLPTEENAYTVSIEEEDITLDELLDLVAQKAGCDWGVDMQNKTIYFYSASINSSASSNSDLW